MVGNLDFLYFFIDFFSCRVQNLSSSYSVHKSSGDRLEELDKVEGLIKDVIENWDSIQEACRDAYPSEGYMIN